MRKFLTALISVTVGIVLIGAYVYSRGQMSQVVYISPVVLSLGSIDAAEANEVFATFTLHNRTDHALTITKSFTSCVCTGLSVPDVPIPGGNSAKLTMKIETKRLKGHQRITAIVWTDNPEYPYFELAANGDFTDNNSVSPFSITLPPLTPGQAVHHKYEIFGYETKSVSENLLFDTLEMRCESNQRDGSQVSNLVFEGTAPSTKGRYTKKFSIVLGGVSEPVEADVHVNVLDRFATIPSEVNFGIVGRNMEVVRELRFVDRRSSKIKDVFINQDSRGILLQQVQIAGAVAKLKLKFTASAREEFINDHLNLSVTLHDGSVENLSLPVRARIIDSP